jgi:glycosyltransferase involved in cell wall biosynthesis
MRPKTMLYLDLPTGAHHGWGICGDNLSRALADFTRVERLRDGEASRRTLDGPLLQSVGPDLRPDHPDLTANRRVGYVMFEEDEVVRQTAATALDGFDHVIAACRWGEDVLRDGGLTNVTTIPQGIDTTIFNPSRRGRGRFGDRFVIFSGGKFELRKGQDIVACAFRVFAERHSDAFLVAAWHNPFPASARTMIASPYLPFRLRNNEPVADGLGRWLTNARIDPSRVWLAPQLLHAELADLYADTDVGLFPNRCEGATNLLLMEYMACGRPTIATDFSGQREVLTDSNSLPLRAWRPARSRRNGAVVAHWCEPNADEILDSLEYAYAHRERLADLGRQAAADLGEWTWQRSARSFLEVLQIPIASTD